MFTKSDCGMSILYAYYMHQYAGGASSLGPAIASFLGEREIVMLPKWLYILIPLFLLKRIPARVENDPTYSKITF